MQASNPLTAEELAAIDATYEPIPEFAQWPTDMPNPELWERERAELRMLRETATQDALRTSVETAIRAAAWDTGAIEGLYKTDRGLTMTVATQAAAWEIQVAERAPDARAFFEAQLHAYELVMDAVTQSLPVNEVWIRRLHEVLTSPQHSYIVQTSVGPQEHPLPRGAYKEAPNHVRTADGSVHAYAPLDMTASEMGRLVEELRSARFEAAHPVAQASYAHYCLAAIHPFADGNGRVARAVASVYLYRAASIPLLVLDDQRDFYLQALEAADRRNYAPFVGFVAEAVLVATRMVIGGLLTAREPAPGASVAALRRLLTAQGGLTHIELDALAQRLTDEVVAMLQTIVDALDLPPGVTVGDAGWSGQDAPAGYRPAAPSQAMARGVVFKSSPPAETQRGVGVEAVISTADDESDTFMLVERSTHGRGEPQTLPLGLRELHPELTAAAQYRIRAFLVRLVGVTLDRFTEDVRKHLGSAGYTGYE
jgi:Fic family protein